MKISLALAAVTLFVACATAPLPHRDAQLIDYHQHLVSRAFAPIGRGTCSTNTMRPQRRASASSRWRASGMFDRTCPAISSNTFFVTVRA